MESPPMQLFNFRLLPLVQGFLLVAGLPGTGHSTADAEGAVLR